MKGIRVIAAIIFLAGLQACSENPTPPVGGETITLTATQAAGLVSSVESFGSSDPTLASLADTVDEVLKAGAQAKRIEITTDLGANVFYAVSLHRASNNSTSPWSTFHIIGFDDASAPKHFIILGGYASGAAPPNAVSGPIGGGSTTSLTAHLFSVSSGQLSRWHASAGSVSLTSMELLEQCVGAIGNGCVRGTMDATFNITATVPGNGTTGQRTASGSITAIPGIRLSF
jgi:hypothetical protein